MTGFDLHFVMTCQLKESCHTRNKPKQNTAPHIAPWADRTPLHVIIGA